MEYGFELLEAEFTPFEVLDHPFDNIDNFFASCLLPWSEYMSPITINLLAMRIDPLHVESIRLHREAVNAEQNAIEVTLRMFRYLRIMMKTRENLKTKPPQTRSVKDEWKWLNRTLIEIEGAVTKTYQEMDLVRRKAVEACDAFLNVEKLYCEVDKAASVARVADVA